MGNDQIVPKTVVLWAAGLFFCLRKLRESLSSLLAVPALFVGVLLQEI
ncbi:MAG: hypothetical protein M3Z07_00185 [Candidatus Eremiobacteraeota bacterium]|nr:hypothetical protein [Candidatus Eremiobacteraeota bacterium]MDQ6822904.1 hypothetical protein [Candidatus Eremiobacteraeota bacterium]